MDNSWDARSTRRETTARVLALLAILALTVALVMALRTSAARLSDNPDTRIANTSLEASA